MVSKRVWLSVCIAVAVLLPLAVWFYNPFNYAQFDGRYYVALGYTYFFAFALIIVGYKAVSRYRVYTFLALPVAVALLLSEVLALDRPAAVVHHATLAVFQGVIGGIVLAYGVIQFLLPARLERGTVQESEIALEESVAAESAGELAE